jgi:uncharacterized protein involved in exopolysaccharide biosynthesis
MTDPRPQTDRTDVDAFDIREPLRELRRVTLQHKAIVIGTCLLTVALVIVFVKLRPPVYEASLTLLTDSNTDPGRDSFYDKWNYFRKDDVQSEPHLIAGGSVLAVTMNKLDLGWDDVHHGVGSQLGHWWMHSPVGKAYRELKEEFFPREQSDWDLTDEQREKIMALIDLKSAVNFQGVNETYVGTLSVKGPTKQVAEIANTIVESYLEQRVERHVEEATRAHDALALQVEGSLARLLDLEQQVQDWRESNEILMDFDTERSRVAQWTQMEMELLLDEARLTKSKAELAVIKGQLAEEPEELKSASTIERNAIKETLKSKLLTHELTLVDAQHRYNPDAPEVLDLKHTMDAIEERLDETEDMILASEARGRNATYDALREHRDSLIATIAGLEEGIGQMRDAFDLHKQDLLSLPEKQRVLQALVREAQLADSEYRVLVDKQISARISIAAAESTAPTIRIIEPAMPPDSPIWPKTKFMVVGGLVVGLFLGVAAAWLRDILDSRVRRHHLARGRGAAPLLGSVRMTGGQQVRPGTGGSKGS